MARVGAEGKDGPEHTIQARAADALRMMANRVDGGGYGTGNDVDLYAIEDDVIESFNSIYPRIGECSDKFFQRCMEGLIRRETRKNEE